MNARDNLSLPTPRVVRIVFSFFLISCFSGWNDVVHGFLLHPIPHGITRGSCLASPKAKALQRSSQAVRAQVESFSESSADSGRRAVAAVPDDDQAVPSTLREALRIFFLSGDFGPSFVVISIMSLIQMRIQLSPLDVMDVAVFVVAIFFWAFQEYFLHQQVLHSEWDWVGKDIHQRHHEKPFYHISIESAPLLLGWLFTAHMVLRTLLPLPLALTATVAYSTSGLFYEWAHFIVHTKVRFRSPFWKRVKENHVRHHMVSDRYWFAFSMPFMDDLFHTNPSIRQVKQQLNEEKQRRSERQKNV